VKIQKIGIIGLGLIGGSIAKAIKSAGISVDIYGYDKKEIIQAALKEKSIDFSADSFSGLSDCELIFICLPVDATLSVIEEIAPILKKGAVVTDVCGVKSAIQQKWDFLKSDGIYFGGHPMAGKEKGGYENSDPLLFENAVYIISDKAKNNTKADGFLTIISSLGCRIIFLSPRVHDFVVANVSHLPQLVSVALVNSVSKDTGDIRSIDFAAGGFKDMTRIASSNFDIWQPVITNNKTAILNSLDNLIDELNAIKSSIIKNDDIFLENKFENARVKRDEIPATRKGFITPLYDITVFIKDQPGVISQISSALYKMDINIKDIELLKIREGTGGNFRMAFESEETANKAKEVIKNIGFEAV